MEFTPETPAHPAKIERQNSYNRYLIDLLDRRHTVEQMICENDDYRGYYSYEGFHTDSFEPPEFLDAYIQPFNPATMDISAFRDADETLHLSRIAIYPEDSAPLSIEHDGTFTVLRQAGEIVSVLAAGSIPAVLRQLAPAVVRQFATDDQILQYVGESSPGITSTVEWDTQINNLTSTISFSKIETVDDSIETLAISRHLPHPSDGEIGLRLSVTESLNRRQQDRNSSLISRSATIEVARPDATMPTDWAIEELLSSNLDSPHPTTVEIVIATRQHLEAINVALAALPQKKE